MKKKLLYLLLLTAAALNFSSCDDDETPKTMPTVKTAIPSNITATSATVGGTIIDIGNDAVTTSGVVYSSNVTLPTIADNKVELTVTSGVFTTEVSGLSSGTTYHVRAFATNSVGTSYGDVIDMATDNAAPVALNVSIAGTLEVGKPVTAVYTYDDSEKDPEGETTFQWYFANSAVGTGETKIAGATSKVFTIEDSENGKFLRVSVTPKATTGNTNGAEVKSIYTTAIGEETVTFTYYGGEVTYGTIIGSSGKKWLDRNLGAKRPAQSLDDYEAYGDLFQWGRLSDGHQVIQRTGKTDAEATPITGATASGETSSEDVPSTNKFIVNTSLTGDWRIPQNADLWQGNSPINNPCPTGWRIPTIQEWTDEGLASLPDAFTKLKMTFTGIRSNSDPNVSLSDYGGYYWSTSTIKPGTRGYSYKIELRDATYEEGYTNRAFAMACRCIKE